MNLDTALSPLRKQIDAIDDEIVRLLNQRGALSLKIGQIKRSIDPSMQTVQHRERELNVLQRILKNNQGPFTDAQLTLIYELIFEVHRALQRGETHD